MIDTTFPLKHSWLGTKDELLRLFLLKLTSIKMEDHWIFWTIKPPLANSTRNKQKRTQIRFFLVSFTHLGEISFPLHNSQQNRSTTQTFLDHPFWRFSGLIPCNCKKCKGIFLSSTQNGGGKNPHAISK